MTNKAYAVIGSAGSALGVEADDDFAGSSLDASKWDSYASGAGFATGVSGGQLQCALASSITGYAGVWSASTYDLTGSYAQAEFANPSTAASGSSATNMAFVLGTAQGNPQATVCVYWILSQGVIYAGYQTTTGGPASNVYSDAWSSAYAHLRIREASGTTYWDSSPDGATWVNRGSLSDPIAMTALYAGMYGWNYSTGDPGGEVAFASFALGPSSPVLPAVTASAVVVAPDGSVVAALTSITATFSYGDTEEDVRAAVVAAVRDAADDATVDVAIAG